jgi:chromosomal replication initiator protein
MTNSIDQSQIQQLWRSILGEIELITTKAEFNTWFQGSHILELKENQITIGTPNGFAKIWLQQKFTDTIKNLLKKYWPEPIEKIIFTYSKNKNESKYSISNTINLRKTEISSANTQQQSTIPEFGLNPRYTFENFVVGQGNELAFAAAKAVADSPGLIYNPLFIYGGVGLGKTHLMQAIGNQIKAMLPQKKILYISTEKFINDFIYSIKQNSVNEFKRKYRTVDVLLVDDIQFISGKESTQEEFFHTFNELYQNNKQIVLTSDRPPKELESLENRLLSRFEWGMIADIRTPDLETRIAILQNKAQDKGIILDSDSVVYIAKMVQNNIRELEGFLNKLLAYQQINNTPLTLENIKVIMGNNIKINQAKKNLTPQSLLTNVCKYFNISGDEILSKTRTKHLVYPRQILCYLLKNEANYSYPAIGKFLNGRDHTTILHAVSKLEKEIHHNEQLRQDMDNIKKAN